MKMLASAVLPAPGTGVDCNISLAVMTPHRAGSPVPRDGSGLQRVGAGGPDRRRLFSRPPEREWIATLRGPRPPVPTIVLPSPGTGVDCNWSSAVSSGISSRSPVPRDGSGLQPQHASVCARFAAVLPSPGTEVDCNAIDLMKKDPAASSPVLRDGSGLQCVDDAGHGVLHRFSRPPRRK